MVPSPSSSRDNKDLVFLTIFLAVAIVVFELWMSTTDHENSRDQHLGGAIAYAKGHIDLLRPMLPGFNANGTPTTLEFPLWQAVTAVLMKCFGLWHGWGNIVSLTFFFGSLWALFDLCRRLCSVRVAWWAMVFSLCQPLSFIVGGQAGGDGTAWSFAMWLIYFSYRMLNEKKWGWWVAASFAGCLCALTKAPFFMAAGLTAFFWLLLHHRYSGRAWISLASVGLIGALSLLAWNFHCHRVYVEAEFPTMNIDPFDKNSGIHHWYFGTLAYRLSLHNWLRGGWHLISVSFAGLSFILLPLLCFRLKQSVEAWLWLLSAVCTTLVFTPLLLEHLHYFFIYAPAIAWLCAIPAAEFEGVIWNRLEASAFTRTAIMLITIVASLVETFSPVHFDQLFDPYLGETSQIIKEHTTPDEKIVIWGWRMLWGDLLVQADREGLNGGGSLDDENWINDPGKLNRLRQLGYKKIVLVNPSPFAIALDSVTGKRGEEMADLHQSLPAVAKKWPVVFDNPQILIVQIPDQPTNN
jgi:hypothetical protein